MITVGLVVEPEPQELVFSVPDSLEAGAYANVASVWHTPYEFTIDFGVLGQSTQRDGDGARKVPVRITSRVRLPVGVVFPLLRALNTNLAAYEQRFGPVPTAVDELQVPPDRPDQGDDQ